MALHMTTAALTVADARQLGEQNLGYGMHRDKTRNWLRQYDEQYCFWCRENSEEGTSMRGFVDWCATMDAFDFGGPVVMGFGKHRDKTRKWVKDHDPDYCEWARGQGGKPERFGVTGFERFAWFLQQSDKEEKKAASQQHTPARPATAAAAPASAQVVPRRRRRDDTGDDASHTSSSARRRLLPTQDFSRSQRPNSAPRHWICGRHGCDVSKGPITVRKGLPHNIGRQFFLCPQKTSSDDCSLDGGFRWADGSSPFSEASCRRVEVHHGLTHGSIMAGIVSSRDCDDF